MKRVAILMLALLPARLATAIDLVEYTINEATYLVQMTSTGMVYIGGISALKPAEQTDLIKRSASCPAPVRAILLYQLAAAKNAQGAAELQGLLKPGVLTGKFKFPRHFDPLRWREMAFDGRERKRLDLQSFASSLILAQWGLPETAASLSQQVQILRKPWGSGEHATPMQEALIAIGLLHQRGVSTAESQQALEMALRNENDPTIRKLAAQFMGATGSPRSIKVLFDALVAETETGCMKQIVRTLIVGGDYADTTRVSMALEFLRIAEDAKYPTPNRQWCDFALRNLAGRERAEDVRAWIAKREKELGFTAEKAPWESASGSAAPAPPPAAPAEGPAPSASTPASKPEETAPAAPKPNRERECTMWLLLAKNFLNAKNYDKAEENIRRILDAEPNGSSAAEARKLQKQVDAARKGAAP